MRVSVVGTSGSGKTTFANLLAKELGVHHIELDAINWQANWQGLNEQDPDEFRKRVSQAVSNRAWVACGNCSTARSCASDAYGLARLSETCRDAESDHALIRSRDREKGGLAGHRQSRNVRALA